MPQLAQKPDSITDVLMKELCGASAGLPGNNNPINGIATRLGLNTNPDGSPATVDGKTVSSGIARSINTLVALSDRAPEKSVREDALQLLAKLAAAIKDEVQGPARYLRLASEPILHTAQSGTSTLQEFLEQNRQALGSRAADRQIDPVTRADNNEFLRSVVEKVAPTRKEIAEKIISGS